jgi:hypothetical protein
VNLAGSLTSGRLAVALSAAALFCAVGGGAYAAGSSSSSNTISVCVKHAGGELYQAKHCAKHDKKLSWNKAGVAGATGATGPAGAAGPGAQLISANVATGGSSSGTIDGVWSYSLTCTSNSPYDRATITLNGPGTVAAAADINTQAPTSYPAIGVSGASFNITGGPLELTLWLQNGSTAAEVHLLMWSTTACSVVGGATPLAS